MASIFEAMGGYESAPVEEEDQPATPKRRRVDEYTMKLTPHQWRILEALADGAMFSARIAPASRLCMLIWNDAMEWCGRSTPASLEKRGLIAKDGILYQITDGGKHALRIREQNKPGQI